MNRAARKHFVESHDAKADADEAAEEHRATLAAKGLDHIRVTVEPPVGGVGRQTAPGVGHLCRRRPVGLVPGRHRETRVSAWHHFRPSSTMMKPMAFTRHPSGTRGALAEERLMRRVEKTSEDGCWYWIGPTTNGYGRFWNGERNEGVHRCAFELWVASIPPGLDVDHVCHNTDPTCPGGVTCLHRRCVNPRHLAVATRSENLRSSPHVGDCWRARTHCANGHEYTEANTHRTAGRPATRRCRTCDAARKRASRSAATAA